MQAHMHYQPGPSGAGHLLLCKVLVEHGYLALKLLLHLLQRSILAF